MKLRKAFGVAEFIRVRSVLVTRLTVFNARRGSEPARLMMSEWQDAEAGEWLDPQSVNNLTTDDQDMVSRYKLAYQAGKGSKDLVPLLIPADAVPGIRKLVTVAIATKRRGYCHHRCCCLISDCARAFCK